MFKINGAGRQNAAVGTAQRRTIRLQMNRTAKKELLEAAVGTVQEQDVITLSARDRQVFVKALLKPKPPGQRLRKAAKRYKSLTGI
jgi:uncharacterized protein (DUF1778 family)